MASRRVLGKVFEGRQFFCKAENALNGNRSARFVETLEFQGFDPWFLQRRAVVIPAQSHACRSLICGGLWWEDLRNLNKAAKQSLRLDVVHPPEGKISPEQGTKFLRVVQEDLLLKRLRQIPLASISRKELLHISMEFAAEENAKEIVKSLDDSGQILIVGDSVYLRPEHIARVMDKILPLLNNSSREELKEMEKQKAEIDVEVKKLVRRELWCALGFMSLQTAYLMRLTFWELSWDVMEPICFFLTSIYFSAGYAFFLRTSADPTLHAFSKARFEATQKRLMKKMNFDMGRLKELRLIASSPVKPSACGGLFPEI